jgi:hypothetical protein
VATALRESASGIFPTTAPSPRASVTMSSASTCRYLPVDPALLSTGRCYSIAVEAPIYPWMQTQSLNP